ncbi:MAG: hypothetical protein ACM36B_05835 [Bacteroidota bacterium]
MSGGVRVDGTDEHGFPPRVRELSLTRSALVDRGERPSCDDRCHSHRTLAMPTTPAACPHCRARLGLRTLFALGDLWDPRVCSLTALRLDFRCYACARTLRYPLSTFASFLALAVLPVVSMALFRDLGLAGWSAPIPSLMAPYWAVLGAAYSYLAAPVLAMAAPRR